MWDTEKQKKKRVEQFGDSSNVISVLLTVRYVSLHLFKELKCFIRSLTLLFNGNFNKKKKRQRLGSGYAYHWGVLSCVCRSSMTERKIVSMQYTSLWWEQTSRIKKQTSNIKTPKWLKTSEFKLLITQDPYFGWKLNILKLRKHFSLLFFHVWLLSSLPAGRVMPSCLPTYSPWVCSSLPLSSFCLLLAVPASTMC